MQTDADIRLEPDTFEALEADLPEELRDGAWAKLVAEWLEQQSALTMRELAREADVDGAD